MKKKRILKVISKNGLIMLKYDMQIVRAFRDDVMISAFLPEIPKDGESMVLEIRRI